jgi:hypothetical protein
MNLIKYISEANRSSILTMVPIEHLNEVRDGIKETDGKFRVVYRGPRNLPEDVKNRPRLTRRAGCLKKYATHFSVYRI